MEAPTASCPLQTWVVKLTTGGSLGRGPREASQQRGEGPVSELWRGFWSRPGCSRKPELDREFL